MVHFKEMMSTTNIFSNVNDITGSLQAITFECLPGVGVELTGGGAL
jgi:hypothetical protein